MGYTADGKLEDLFPKRFIPETSEKIADRVGDRWRDRVAMRTPVARLPAAYHGDFEEWIADRGGRKPRTMRDAWRRTEVIRIGANRIRVEVYNIDPRVIFVEEDTQPHRIRAKVRPGPPPYQGSLRFPQGSQFRFAVEVQHPGTQGVHMQRDTTAEMEVMWLEIGEEVLEEQVAKYNAR